MALRTTTRGRLGALAVVLVAAAAALVAQPPGCNQTAHLALAKALLDGTPQIDQYESQTCDDAFIDGHFFAAKAPGLALVTVPWLGLLQLTGLVAADPSVGRPWPDAMIELPREATWQAGLLGAVLAALALLLLVRSVCDRLVPGYGTVAAITIGVGSLLLPFATLFFAHVLSATLGFGAFALLLQERGSPGRVWAVALAGLLAGLAIVVEFPLVLVAAVLFVLACLRPPAIARGLAFAGGVLGGIVPLLAFNTWALGSPFRLTYTNAVISPGASGHDVVGANDRGVFGLGSPSPRGLLELLASGKGLLVLTPVAAAGLAGLVLLHRGGRRVEAATAGAVVVLFLVYNASYFLPFGGWVPGPRFLVPALPFLALGIAAAYRACWPPVLALAAVSAGWMTAATLAGPVTEGEDALNWLRTLRNSDPTWTVVTLLGGGHGVAEAMPVIVLLVAACVIAVAVLPKPRPTTHDLWLTVAAVASWAVVAGAAPELLRTDRAVEQSTGAIATALLLLTIALAWIQLTGGRAAVALAASPLLLLVLPGVAAHTKWSLALVLFTLVALLSVERFGIAGDRRTT